MAEVAQKNEINFRLRPIGVGRILRQRGLIGDRGLNVKF
jgi:hypothetical protein